MVAVAKEVGAHRYRESYGRYFEDFTEGDTYEHRPGRTISEADNTWFTLLTINHLEALRRSKCPITTVFLAAPLPRRHVGKALGKRQHAFMVAPTSSSIART